MKTGTTIKHSLAAPLFALAALGQAYAATPFVDDAGAQRAYISDRLPSAPAAPSADAITHTVNGVFEFGMDTLRMEDTELAWKSAANAMIYLALHHSQKFALLACQAPRYTVRPLLVDSITLPVPLAAVTAKEAQIARHIEALPKDQRSPATDAQEGATLLVSYKSAFIPLLEWIANPRSRWQGYIQYESSRGRFPDCSGEALTVQSTSPASKPSKSPNASSFHTRFDAVYTTQTGHSAPSTPLPRLTVSNN